MEEDRTMSSRDLLKGLLAAVLVMLTYQLSSALLPITEPMQLFAQGDSWSPLIHLQWNSFYEWRVAPYLFDGLLYLPILALGLVAWLGARLSAFLTSGIVLLLFPLIFGKDITVAGAAALLPISIAYLTNEKRLPLVVSLAGALLVSSQTALVANQLSPLVIAVALAVSWPTLKEDHRRKRLLLLFILTPPILTLLLAPNPIAPLYPVKGTVVPDDGVAGVIRAALGPDASIAYTDRARVALSLPAALLLTTLAGCSLFLKRTREAKAATVLGLLALLDVALPTALSIIAPLQTLQRVLPGMLQIPLAAPCLGVSIILAAHGLSNLPGVVTSLIFLVSTLLHPSVFQLTLAPEMKRLLREYEVLREEEPKRATALRKLMISPSLQVVARYGSWITELEGIRDDFRSPGRLVARTFSSIEGDVESSHRVLYDRNSSTRWTSSGAVQRPDTRLCMEFRQPLKIRGVEASPGAFHSDFPRGIAIEAGETCQASRVVEKRAPWLGTIKFTEDGYPYYSHQGEVKVVLTEPVEAGCVCIVQTENFAGHDWSVAELNLMTER